MTRMYAAVGGALVWRFLGRGLINSQLMSAYDPKWTGNLISKATGLTKNLSREVCL